jgi:hypothetical protein
MIENETKPKPTSSWRDQLHQYRLGGVTGAVLQALEPLAPLLAQLLYVVQPLARVVGGHRAVGELADQLETPQGIAQLRADLRAGDETHERD